MPEMPKEEQWEQTWENTYDEAEKAWNEMYEEIDNFVDIYEGWFTSDFDAFMELYGEIYNAETSETLLHLPTEKITELYNEWRYYGLPSTWDFDEMVVVKIETPDLHSYVKLHDKKIEEISFYLYKVMNLEGIEQEIYNKYFKKGD